MIYIKKSFRNHITISQRFGLVLWHINHCWLFNANPVFTYILDIHDLVWLGFITYQSLLVI